MFIDVVSKFINVASMFVGVTSMFINVTSMFLHLYRLAVGFNAKQVSFIYNYLYKAWHTYFLLLYVVNK